MEMNPATWEEKKWQDSNLLLLDLTLNASAEEVCRNLSGSSKPTFSSRSNPQRHEDCRFSLSSRLCCYRRDNSIKLKNDKIWTEGPMTEHKSGEEIERVTAA